MGRKYRGVKKQVMGAKKSMGSQEPSCAICDGDAAFIRSARPPYEALRPRVRVVDLFAGCGGLSLGVAEAARRLGLGIDVRLAVDLDADATSVYKANFPGADVRHLRVEELFDGKVGSPATATERKLKTQVGKLDVLVGGPPCQGHSDLNNHTRRDDPRNALYARMARATEVLRPRLVLIENVPTVTHDVDKVVEATVKALEGIGYSVADAVVDIARLGAPQGRRRHVVFASRRADVGVKDIVSRIEHRCPAHLKRTVHWAIEDLKGVQSDTLFDSASVPNADNVERIAWLFEHGKYDLPNLKRPVCHQSDHSYNAMYGRLRWDAPAQTVTTGFGSMGQGRYVHPSKRRTITPHEAARLQMLPDFWDFSVVKKRGSLAQLIGNAVPPVLAAALIEPALRSLGLGPGKRSSASATARPRRAARRVSSRKLRRRSPDVPMASSAEALERMQATRQRDTGPELALRAELHRRGLRYVVNQSLDAIRGRADIAFRGPRIAVYVDGCFWHGCPQHRTAPKANRRWWADKLAANRRRDAATDEQLRAAGWTILRFWEHEKASVAAAQVYSVVAQARAANDVNGGPGRATTSSSHSRRSD
jgi:DNA (cytosine-5)-methyltransferase 1